MSALFSFKNDQKREILTIISILPYTDGFFGSIFYILGRFAKMPPPQSCQKVAKKVDFKWRIKAKNKNKKKC